MKHLFWTILIAVVVSGFTAPLLAQRKYDVRCGVITFENSITILGKAVPQKQIIYFDDYGARERKETYEGDSLMEAYICDGKNLFNIIYEEKVAYGGGPSIRGTEPPFEGGKTPSKHGSVKKLPLMRIAGKSCEVIEITEDDSKTILAGWGHIVLYSDQSGSGIHSSSKAVKFVENEPIPRETFAVPKGFVTKLHDTHP